jgi:hypothetical protein
MSYYVAHRVYYCCGAGSSAHTKLQVADARTVVGSHGWTNFADVVDS